MREVHLFLIIIHLAMLPATFSLLKYMRIEELFKRNTPPNVVVLLYVFLTIAISQLVIGFFVNLFSSINLLFP